MPDEKKLPQEYYDKLEFIYKVSQRKLDGVHSAYRALGTKNSILFGFTATTIAFYLKLALDKKFFEGSIDWLFIVRLIGVGCLLSVLFFICLSARPRKFDDYPPQKIIWDDEALKKQYYALQLDVLTEMKRAYNINSTLVDEAALFFKTALWLLFAGILIIIASSLI